MSSSETLKTRIMGLIFAVIFVIAGLTLGDTVVSTVQAVNTTGWTFTGHEAVENVIDLFPLLYYTGIMVGFIVAIYVITKQAGG